MILFLFGQGHGCPAQGTDTKNTRIGCHETETDRNVLQRLHLILLDTPCLRKDRCLKEKLSWDRCGAKEQTKLDTANALAPYPGFCSGLFSA